MTLPKKLATTRFVYLDHAAATPVDTLVLQAMEPWSQKNFSNPSALYHTAVTARNQIEQCREQIADVLFTQPDTIIFTSGGTESTNLAILGVVRAWKKQHPNRKPHIITTQIEHHAVLYPIQALEKEGCTVTYVGVNEHGQIDIAEVKKAFRPETMLVSLMYANNEIGTILPIADIGREILKWRKSQKTLYPYFHTDACQAAPYLDLNVEKLHVDLLSLNGSKVYGPKGIGLLYQRRGVSIEPLWYGGGQERGLRSGTEHVPGIIGLGVALAQASKNRDHETKRVAGLRDYFWQSIQKKIPDVHLNGGMESRLPNNVNVRFTGADAEALILYLDSYGIICSSGSACTTDSDDASHVLQACGASIEEAKSSLRFTLGKETTKKDIEYVLKYLPPVVETVRKMGKQ